MCLLRQGELRTMWQTFKGPSLSSTLLTPRSRLTCSTTMGVGTRTPDTPWRTSSRSHGTWTWWKWPPSSTDRTTTIRTPTWSSSNSSCLARWSLPDLTLPGSKSLRPTNRMIATRTETRPVRKGEESILTTSRPVEHSTCSWTTDYSPRDNSLTLRSHPSSASIINRSRT